MSQRRSTRIQKRYSCYDSCSSDENSIVSKKASSSASKPVTRVREEEKVVSALKKTTVKTSSEQKQTKASKSTAKTSLRAKVKENAAVCQQPSNTRRKNSCIDLTNRMVHFEDSRDPPPRCEPTIQAKIYRRSVFPMLIQDRGTVTPEVISRRSMTPLNLMPKTDQISAKVAVQPVRLLSVIPEARPSVEKRNESVVIQNNSPTPTTSKIQKPKMVSGLMVVNQVDYKNLKEQNVILEQENAKLMQQISDSKRSIGAILQHVQEKIKEARSEVELV